MSTRGCRGLYYVASTIIVFAWTDWGKYRISSVRQPITRLQFGPVKFWTKLRYCRYISPRGHRTSRNTGLNLLPSVSLFLCFLFITFLLLITYIFSASLCLVSSLQTLEVRTACLRVQLIPLSRAYSRSDAAPLSGRTQNCRRLPGRCVLSREDTRRPGDSYCDRAVALATGVTQCFDNVHTSQSGAFDVERFIAGIQTQLVTSELRVSCEDTQVAHSHSQGFFLGAIAKLWKATTKLRHVRLYVRPHGTTRLPLDEFSWNLIFEYFSKIYWENSSFIKIWQQ